MALNTMKPTKNNSNKRLVKYGLIVVFLLVLVIGLYNVKWNPYYHKTIEKAIPKHNIGTSIIVDKAGKAPAFSIEAAKKYFVDYFNAVWKAVVLGLLLGSLVQVAIPRTWIKKAFGGQGLGNTAAAGAAALPGMMCSCCAAPVAVGLRKRSASVNSAVAFFLGNPVLNPATIIFMGFVLGWNYAIFRVVVGLVMVFGIATFAGKISENEDVDIDVVPDYEDEEDLEVGNIFIRWIKALWQLIIDTIPAYLIVVTILGAIRVWLFPLAGSAWVNSIIGIIILAITGTLFVIPTAAEIPLIQTLLSFGLTSGPAGALLMTLPAVSLPSILIIRRGFSRKVLVFIVAGVVTIGIISGILAMFIL